MRNPYANVIVNPAAGAGKTGRAWPHIRDVFAQQGLRFDHHITEGPGHAVELAGEAVGRGYETVVSVGGDGTINEVVNGLHRVGGCDQVRFGCISTGTGGDYARTLGIPRDVTNACRRLVELQTRAVDLGVVEYGNDGNRRERLFANFAGMGFDAEIVRRTTQQFKSLGSLPSYLLGTLSTLISYRNKDVVLTTDGEETEHRVCTVIMNNGRYGGGGMFTAPDAEIDDGLFDVLIVSDVGKLEFLVSLPRIYKGTHLTHRKIQMKKAREVAVRSRNGCLHLQADGEWLGEIPATFRIMPKALKVIV